ncbi:hypothetical protein FEV53_03190 [Palleronia caenipelagi]|uniref:Uncharacterized protein n=1 Tax=Palleronia caenipelagi TaxID=2489174 RepID=A0A547Q8S4_9RHOB|nr:hypothetical protein FEV53_03190 [Palleronia caenipelagi]
MPRSLGVYGAFLALGIPLAFLCSGFIADRLTAETWARQEAIVAEVTATVADGGLENAETGIRAMMGEIDQYQQLAYFVEKLLLD